MMIFTRSEFLELMEKKELTLLNSMSDEELENYLADWFSVAGIEISVAKDGRAQLINDYMTDYMKYKQDYSNDELKDSVRID